jgi:hypothetical protein
MDYTITFNFSLIREYTGKGEVFYLGRSVATVNPGGNWWAHFDGAGSYNHVDGRIFGSSDDLSFLRLTVMRRNAKIALGSAGLHAGTAVSAIRLKYTWSDETGWRLDYEVGMGGEPFPGTGAFVWKQRARRLTVTFNHQEKATLNMVGYGGHPGTISVVGQLTGRF